MFTTALFAIAKTWKQPKCPLADGQIKKMWYIWNITQPKDNDILSFAATWVDLEIIILSEIVQTKMNFVYHLFVESKKDGTNGLIYKTETDSQAQ